MVHNALKGIAFMVASMIFLPLKDGIAKILGTGSGYTALQILWFQFAVVYLILSSIIVWRYGAAKLIPRPLGQQVLRGIFTMTGIGFFYWSIQLIPLATTTAIYFLGPLIVTALSPIILQETVDLRRWIAVVAGFLGVFLILRPELIVVNRGYLIALIGSFAIAGFYMLNRKLATGDPIIVMVAHSVIIGTILLTASLPLVWVPPRWSDVPLFAGFIVFCMTGQLLQMSSFKNAPASIVTPFQYTSILTASTFGFVFLGEFPDGLTWLGIAIVISSGIYIAVREGRIKRSLHARATIERPGGRSAPS